MAEQGTLDEDQTTSDSRPPRPNPSKMTDKPWSDAEDCPIEVTLKIPLRG